MLESISLKLGFMSNEEIINWAQISSNYFLRIRKSWCEKQLSKYAKYNLVKGGVEILEIIKPVYVSNTKKEVEKNFSKCWGYEGYNIDTCKNACRKMQKILDNKINAADITIYSYICFSFSCIKCQYLLGKRCSIFKCISTLLYCVSSI